MRAGHQDSPEHVSLFERDSSCQQEVFDVLHALMQRLLLTRIEGVAGDHLGRSGQSLEVRGYPVTQNLRKLSAE